MFKKINSETSGGTNRQKPLAEEDLIRGDHIYVRRGGLLYSHHGIYAGEGTVINFKGEDKDNCEHFATFCATGKKKSKQIRRAIGSFVTITVFATGTFILKAITRKRND